MYYFYGKINQGHIVCPLYGGGPYFRESVMRCSTVIIWSDAYTFISLASYIVCTPSPIHYAEFHVHVCVHASFSIWYGIFKGTIAKLAVSSSWLTNVDEIKDLWCSSIVQLLSTQT